MTQQHSTVYHRLAVHVALAALLAVAVVLGHASAIDDRFTSPVGVLAGTAVVWCFWAQSRGRRTGRVALAAAGAVTVVAVLAVGSPPSSAWVVAGACVVQAAVGVRFLRRSVAAPASAEPGPPVEPARAFAVLLGAAAVSAAAGTVVAGLGYALVDGTGSVDRDLLLLWWGRDVAGIVVVVALAHLVVERLRGLRAGRWRPSPPSPVRLVETAALTGAAAACFATVFLDGGRTFAPLLGLTLWAAMRSSPLATTAYTTALGVAAVALTSSGQGPFAGNPSPQTGVADVQLLFATLLVLGIVVSGSLANHRRLVARSEEAERVARFRADLFSAVADAMDDGVIVVDAAGGIVMANPAARRLMEQIPGRVSRRGDAVLRYPDGTPVLATAYPSVVAMRDGSSPPRDLVVEQTGHGHRILSVSATRLADVVAYGDGAGAVISYRDVTIERQEHDELAGFAGTVAHDLRGPITAVRSLIELSQLEAGLLEDDRELGSLLDRAHRAAMRMSTLIDEMLDHASSVGQPGSLAEVDLTRAATEVVALHGVEDLVTVDALPTACADELLVRQLLTNLVGNAIKYVRPDVAPSVRIEGRVVDGVVEVSVTDNGLGVPVSERTAIFERLHRAHAERADIPGTGLGLALCRSIVEHHGCHIGVEAAPEGPGSRFWFTLPAPVASTTVGGDPRSAEATSA